LLPNALPIFDDRRVPVAADPEDALALREQACGDVVADRVVVGVEVAGLRPRLELPERLDRPGRVVARSGHVVDPVAHARRVDVGAPDSAEKVDEAVALLVALLDHGVALRQLGPQLAERLVAAGERLRQLGRLYAE